MKTKTEINKSKIWQMNKELSSLNHNKPVFIYRRGGGEGRGGEGRGGSRGLKGNQRGNQSSLTEFKGGLGKIDFQWREGRDGWGGGGGGRGIIGILQNVMEGIR